MIASIVKTLRRVYLRAYQRVLYDMLYDEEGEKSKVLADKKLKAKPLKMCLGIDIDYVLFKLCMLTLLPAEMEFQCQFRVKLYNSQEFIVVVNAKMR